MNIKNIIYKTAFGLSLGLAVTACNIEQMEDPNGMSKETVENGATKVDIQTLVAGTESLMRSRLGTYYDDLNVIGREYYRMSGSDPRFTSDLLGKEEAVLDDNTFYLTGPWAERYRTIKNADILFNAAQNADPSITTNDREGIYGFSKTIKAYSFLQNLNLTYENGIRVDISDPDNLGEFLSYDNSLKAIADLLDEGKVHLEKADEDLVVNMSNEFRGFDAGSVTALLEFNRALAARVAIYRQDYTGAETALSESFMDMGGDMDKGVYHFFSTSGGDMLNDMFIPANSSPGANARIIHPDLIVDAEANDARIAARTSMREATATQDGLSGDYDFMMYKSQNDNIPIIRNEELILIAAEVYAETNRPVDAVNAIDAIRSMAGLPAYAGGTTREELIDAILHERRYSLLGEGHRWLDMRRFNKLGDLTIDRAGDDVWVQFPIPMTEKGI